MTLYVISCALRDASHDYAPLWSALERKGAKRAMEAVWLLETSDPITPLTESILPMLEDDDRLFVGEIGIWSATHLLPEAKDFLQSLMRLANKTK